MYSNRHSCYTCCLPFLISCNRKACSLLHLVCFWWIFKPPDVTEQCYVSVTSNQFRRGDIFTLFSLSSLLLREEYKDKRKEYRELTTEQRCLSISWERVGPRWTMLHFSERLNPAEQFLSWASPGCNQHIHYSCERQGEHVGKLGLAPDLWGLINGPCVLQLYRSGSGSCWLLRGWSDRRRNPAQTNISSIQLFISTWKDWT